jgi:two-component system LytT family response regulator
MEKLKCILLEDEPLARKQMEKYINNYPELELIKSFDHGEGLVDFCENNRVDLAFFDIEVPDENGMSLAKKLRDVGLNIDIIFTTAYSDFAVESYQVDAIDYILKPFSESTFKERLSHFLEKRKERRSFKLNEVKSEYLFVKSNYQIKKIRFDNILYFEGLKDYIQIFLKDEKYPTLVLSNFKKILEKLPEKQFMRTHRSFIVNLEKVSLVEKNRIIFGDTFIPVSETYKEAFFEYLGGKLLD